MLGSTRHSNHKFQWILLTLLYWESHYMDFFISRLQVAKEQQQQHLTKVQIKSSANV